jgi:2-polyprenyl-3-methyl-5-hydroxy-6-metoxy-1,4-benzoquinol methylase
MDDWTKHFDDRFWLLADDMPEEQARFIKRSLGLRKGARVLDAPCGAGRTSLALAKLGLEVTGVDMRSQFTARAKRRFRKEGVTGTFLAGDLRELDYDGEFHAVVNWFSSFGYYDDAVNLDIVRRLARALHPGGRLLIDTANRERVLRHFITRDTTTLAGLRREGSGTLTRRRRWNGRAQRIEARWTLESRRRKLVCLLRMRLYTPGQYRALFSRVGLAFEAVYGSWAGGAYSRASRRMIIVGRKLG